MAHNDSFDEPRFEALYRKLYPDLLRCAEIALRTGGSWYVSVAGRAEEVVQELFAFAWEHQADLWSSASPTGWLYRVLRYKVLELLKEDRFWRKHLIRAAGEMPASPEDDFQQRAEITSILTPEEYEILRKLYLEKYTYEELARELIPWLLEHHFTHVELLPLAEQFVTVAAHTPRAMPAETLADHIRARGGRAEAAADIPAGVARAVELGGDGPVCALGTLYFSGDVRQAFARLTAE